MNMTPERIEGYKTMIRQLGALPPSAANELLAALEETQQQIGQPKINLLASMHNEQLKNESLRNQLVEAQQTIARQQEALEFLADDSNWSWWNVGTEDETVTWVGGTDPQHAAREALGNKEGSDKT